jgi:hypothetical protein
MTWQKVYNVSKNEEWKYCMAYATAVCESTGAKGIAQLDQ